MNALVIPLPGHPKVLKSTRGDLRSGKSYDIALVSVTNVFGQKCSCSLLLSNVEGNVQKLQESSLLLELLRINASERRTDR